MRRINFLMQDTLQNLVRDSILQYGEFVKQASEPVLKIKDMKRVLNDFVNDKSLTDAQWEKANTLASLKRPPALIQLDIRATAEPICLNQEEVDEAAAAKSMETTKRG